jgi:hypothetical protein
LLVKSCWLDTAMFQSSARDWQSWDRSSTRSVSCHLQGDCRANARWYLSAARQSLGNFTGLSPISTMGKSWKIDMELRQNSGMDRPAVIQTYGSVWITCGLVWIGGIDRPVGSGYGSGLYILTRSHMCIYIHIYIFIERERT